MPLCVKAEEACYTSQYLDSISTFSVSEHRLLHPVIISKNCCASAEKNILICSISWLATQTAFSSSPVIRVKSTNLCMLNALSDADRELVSVVQILDDPHSYKLRNSHELEQANC